MSKTLEQLEALARLANDGDDFAWDILNETATPDVILRLVEIVKAAEKVPTSDEIRLAAGELSAQEMRSVKAILHWRASIIASLREALSKT